ncbi:hypothetical protein LXM96_06955 [Rhizobium sp. TRM95001]|nr:hypothetical protein [Rhizobium halophilum]MCF6368593.1 hypothetical protein [Rhizobium halophilum]
MKESTGSPEMTGISIALRTAVAAALVFGPAHGVEAQSDAFKSFKQLDSTAKMPKLNAFSAPPSGEGAVTAKDVKLQAKLTATDERTVEEGLAWRVFSPISSVDGKLPLVASSEGGGASFQLVPGDYFVNVAFGRAGVTKKLTVPSEGEVEQQVLVLDAGGVVLDATSGSNASIPEDQLSFSIYSSEVRQDGERGLVMADVRPDTIVRLSAGTYHVVSEYGDVNAVVRADIQVEAGKLVEATLQHRAAQITLKLVSQPGGEAIADTAWSVLTAAGDIVNESVSAFSTMVLAEGDYLAVARNKDKIYQRAFSVQAAENTDVEVMMKDQPANMDLFSDAALRD